MWYAASQATRGWLEMQCAQCGQDLPEEARFCNKCGAAVTGEATPAQAPVPILRVPMIRRLVMVQAISWGASCLGFIIVPIIVVAIVLPRVLQARQTAKEAEARATLQSLRNSVKEFEADCHVYPRLLADISAQSAPNTGLVWTGTAVEERPINPKDWKGPYIEELPRFPPLPINSLTGANEEGMDWIYNPPGKPLGTVRIGGVTGNDSAGTPYSEW